jgi:hypothetical protein
MDTKISLTLYDIVGYVVPGSISLALLSRFGGFQLDAADSQFGILFLVYAYALGLVLHLASLFLGKEVYVEDSENTKLHVFIGWWDKHLSSIRFITCRPVSAPIKSALEDAYRDKLAINLKADGFAANRRLLRYILADALVVRIGLGERDVLAAKIGMLRALSVVMMLAAYRLIFECAIDSLLLALGAVLIAKLLIDGGVYYRELKNQQIYTLALLGLKA